MGDVIELRPAPPMPAAPKFVPKTFTARIGGGVWTFSSNVCNNVDVVCPHGSFCLTPDEIIAVMMSLRSALSHSVVFGRRGKPIDTPPKGA